MKIGYLHVGPQEHGLHRYGRLLAEEAKTRDNCAVIEANILLSKNWWQNLITLYRAAQQFADVDVVHFQYNKAIWGEALSILNLIIFACSCKASLVVTMHDVYWEQFPFTWSRPITYLKAMYGPKALAIRFLISQMNKVFVCTEQELNRLQSVSSMRHSIEKKVVTIPHFVEDRKIYLNTDQIRQSLQLEQKRVITLLGWIHFRKGHHLLLEALPKLPADTEVIFAGKANKRAEDFLEKLVTTAKEFNVADRLKITGYLSEEDLERYITVTDIAVCPFSKCSASGSLSTWISISHPKIVAYKIPQIEEYNKLEPGAIHTFESYNSDSLVDILMELLSDKKKTENTAVKRLQDRLNMANIFDRHLNSYAQIFDLKKQKLSYKILKI
ncbi:glycosyltransferase [Leptolyngbya sp. PCC 7375]|nr:glycosyltransferase [Leptolyngbya sp. PCC 7375]